MPWLYRFGLSTDSPLLAKLLQEFHVEFGKQSSTITDPPYDLLPPAPDNPAILSLAYLKLRINFAKSPHQPFRVIRLIPSADELLTRLRIADP